MTGLDESKETIMEAAVLVTDGELNVVAEGPNIVIKVADSILDSMNEWCTKHHGEVRRIYNQECYNKFIINGR